MLRMVLCLLLGALAGTVVVTSAGGGEVAGRGDVADGEEVSARGDAPVGEEAASRGDGADAADAPDRGFFRLVHTYQSKITAPLGVIEDPTGLHVARDGTVFVADAELHRVQRFTPDGVPLGEYGKPGREPGQLLRPSGIATDLAGDRVYVSDTGNDRVAIFHLDGRFAENWLGLVAPSALAVGAEGTVYVHQGGNANNISVRRWDGSEVTTFNVFAVPGLREPGVAGGMATSEAGLLYLAMGSGVQVFAADGEFKKFMRPGGSTVTRDISFDHAGRMYVLEGGRLWYQINSREFNGVTMGSSVRAIGAGAPGLLFFMYPKTPERPATVALRRFDQARPTAPKRWGVPQTVLGWLNQPFRLSVGADGDIYTVDNLRRVQRFPARLDGGSGGAQGGGTGGGSGGGQGGDQGGAPGGALGQLLLPGLQEVTATAGGDLIVARKRYAAGDLDPDDPDAPPPGMQRVIVERYGLGAGGGLLAATPGDAPPPLWRFVREEAFAAPDASHVAGMAYDAARDRTYVLDGVKKQVWAIDGAGRELPRIDLPAIDAGLPGWRDLAVGPQGELLVLHGAARRVYRFTVAGAAGGVAGGMAGAVDGVMDAVPDGVFVTPEWPWRIDVDGEGNVVIATARRWMWLLDAAGGPRALWALPAPIEGNPDPPADVAVGRGDGGVDDGGGTGDRVYVLDQAAAAIYVFAPDGDVSPGVEPDHRSPLPLPPPGVARPAAGSLGCEVQANVAVAPPEVLIGTPAEVSLSLTGDCAAHRRTGDRPAVLLHSAVVSVTLPVGVDLVAGSLVPPGAAAGRVLSWRLAEVPADGITLRYAVTSGSSNRWRVLERGGMAWLDGWFNYGGGEVAASTRFWTLLPPTATDTPRATATAEAAGAVTPRATTTVRPGGDGRRVWLPWGGVQDRVGTSHIPRE